MMGAGQMRHEESVRSRFKEKRHPRKKKKNALRSETITGKTQQIFRTFCRKWDSGSAAETKAWERGGAR